MSEGDIPCVGVCMLDLSSGACLGCGRTAEEIVGLPPAESAEANARATKSGETNPNEVTTHLSAVARATDDEEGRSAPRDDPAAPRGDHAAP